MVKLAEQSIGLHNIDGGEVFTPVDRYAAQLGYPHEDTFVSDLIRAGTVLDLGSGLGGLAIDSYMRRIPCTIHSVNPRLETTSTRTDIAEATRRHSEMYINNLPFYRHILSRKKSLVSNLARRALEYHNSHAHAIWAHNLSRFADGYFGLVVDNKAVSMYASKDPWDYLPPSDRKRLLFQASIQEMLRVTRTGGKIRIGDPYGFDGNSNGRTLPWREQVLQNLGLVRGTNYRVITDNSRWSPPWRGELPALGVEIWKH